MRSLNISVPLVITVPFNKWQHHSWFCVCRNWPMVEAVRSDENFLIAKDEKQANLHRCTFLWSVWRRQSGQDTVWWWVRWIKKIQRGVQHCMTKCGMVLHCSHA
jgi:hypothetical protein